MRCLFSRLRPRGRRGLLVRATLALLLAISAPPASAAPRTVTGQVLDAATGAPVEAATVLTDAGDGGVADEDGTFEVSIEPRSRRVTVVAPGYRARVVSLSADGGALRVELEADATAEVISVEGESPEQTRPTSYQLTGEEIRRVPGAGNDVLRAVQSLPGVARIPYNFGGLVLRGQSPRDSSVFLDGIEVPLAFHFGGVTSFYPASILSELEITNGGFDASWGRTQGGVISLTTREARTDGWRAGGEVGLLHSGALAEGPLPGGGGLIVGVRRSYLDTIVDPFVADTTPLPSYLDAQVRASWGDPRRWGRLIPQVFTSIDRVTSSELSLTSAFVRSGLTYRKSWGPTHLDAVAWGGWNGLSFSGEAESDEMSGEEMDPVATEFRRPTYVFGTRAELTRDTAWGHLRGGLDAQGGRLGQIGVTTDQGPQSFATALWWQDVAGYAEARWQTSDGRLSAKPSVRVERYGAIRQWVLDPRLNLHQRLTKSLTLRQALGRFHQQPTPMEVEPTLGNPKLRSSYTDQLSVGLEVALPGHVEASLTGFWHHGHRQPVAAVRPGPDPEVPEPNRGGLGPIFQELLEDQFGSFDYHEATGRSRSRGVELSLRRSVGRWFGFVAYTLARAERTDDPKRFTGWRPYQLDQTHHLTAIGSVGFARWRLGGRLSVVSGNPYSPGAQTPDAAVAPWSARLPLFVSMDVRADRVWHRSWGDISLYIDVQNATNRRNVEGRETDEDGATSDLRGLPILPFFGVELIPRP
ncbi:MAG: TonB-dependent receptor [Kofleriaceae bacterium]